MVIASRLTAAMAVLVTTDLAKVAWGAKDPELLESASWVENESGTVAVFRSSEVTGPDSSSGRASASGAGGRRFVIRPRHTKGVKNGTSGYLAWRSAL